MRGSKNGNEGITRGDSQAWYPHLSCLTATSAGCSKPLRPLTSAK